MASASWLHIHTGFWGFRDPHQLLPGRKHNRLAHQQEGQGLVRTFLNTYMKDAKVYYCGDEGLLMMLFGKRYRYRSMESSASYVKQAIAREIIQYNSFCAGIVMTWFVVGCLQMVVYFLKRFLLET